jgi:hypothetical protein
MNAESIWSASRNRFRSLKSIAHQMMSINVRAKLRRSYGEMLSLRGCRGRFLRLLLQQKAGYQGENEVDRHVDEREPGRVGNRGEVHDPANCEDDADDEWCH